MLLAYRDRIQDINTSEAAKERQAEENHYNTENRRTIVYGWTAASGAGTSKNMNIT